MVKQNETKNIKGVGASVPSNSDRQMRFTNLNIKPSLFEKCFYAEFEIVEEMLLSMEFKGTLNWSKGRIILLSEIMLVAEA